MRIIAGCWRGRKLPVLPVDGLRPTGDRLRETLFNWLAPEVVGARCLDLFAGSGALSFEALSRGAAAVTAVDSNAAVTRSLRESAAVLATESLEIVTAPAADWLRCSVATPFDIVFLDPPFADGALDEVVALLHSGGWLQSGCLVYIERATTASPPSLPENWRVLRDKRAGAVRYGLYCNDGGDIR